MNKKEIKNEMTTVENHLKRLRLELKTMPEDKKYILFCIEKYNTKMRALNKIMIMEG